MDEILVRHDAQTRGPVRRVCAHYLLHGIFTLPTCTKYTLLSGFSLGSGGPPLDGGPVIPRLFTPRVCKRGVHTPSSAFMNAGFSPSPVSSQRASCEPPRLECRDLDETCLQTGGESRPLHILNTRARTVQTRSLSVKRGVSPVGYTFQKEVYRIPLYLTT